MTPDDCVDLAIVNLADHVRKMRRLDSGTPVETLLACFFLTADLGLVLRDGGASPEALGRFEVAEGGEGSIRRAFGSADARAPDAGTTNVRKDGRGEEGRVSARTRSIISCGGRRWGALLGRCLTALVILAGVVLVFSGWVLAQESGPGGLAPGADTPIDAGIDRSKFEPFRKALDDVERLEGVVDLLARQVGDAEAVLRLAEQGLSVKPPEEARSDLDKARKELDESRKKREKARDKLEEERQKLSPDDRVDLAIVNLAERLWEDGVWVNAFLAGRTVYRTREEAPFRIGGEVRVPLTDVEHFVACWLAIAHLGPALRDGGASRDALERWEEARAKAWKIMTARVDAIVKKLEQTDLFQKGYHFMHAVYHRALAKGDHEQRAAGLAGGGPLKIQFTGPCPGAGCPEEERQRGQTR